MGHIFSSSPQSQLAHLTLGWRALHHSKRALPVFFNAFDVHRKSIIPKPLPSVVSDSRLMAFFAIELTQSPNTRFPTLPVTPAIKRAHEGSDEGPGAKAPTCQGGGC